jgi:hypothetical protein
MAAHTTPQAAPELIIYCLHLQPDCRLTCFENGGQQAHLQLTGTYLLIFKLQRRL